MTHWIKPLLLLALLTTLSGCATQGQLRMERDLDEMKRRLAKAELSLAAQGKSLTGELEQRLDSIGRNQADLQVALDTLKIDVQSVSGRFEDQARERDELRGDMMLVKDDFGLKLTSLEDRVQKLEENRSAFAAAGGGGIVGGMPNSPEGLYEVALEKIQKTGDFAGARESLQLFLKDNPQHPLATNAMYWVGEAYYREKSYENAILQFQDVIQKHPTHPKTPAAMFKQGLAFQALGDTQNARIILRKVQETYPQSEEAGKAKAKLAELK